MNIINPAGIKILIVDDDATVAHGTTRLLTKAGYVTATAANGVEALALMPTFQPHLVLSDRDMPEMDGMELCRCIKSNPAFADVFVVLVSGTFTKSDAQSEGLEAGADGYIARPVANRELLARVESIVRLMHMHHSLQASELRYRRLFESAKDGILILDYETGMVVDVNPFLVDLLGFPRGYFLCRGIWELGFFKDIIANQDNFAELKAKEYIRYNDLPLETADGRRIDVEFVSNVYLANSHKVIQCNIRDITERKRAEDAFRKSETRYRELVGHMKDILFSVNADGTIGFIGPQVQDYGYSQEELLGKNFFQFIFAEDRGAVARDLQREVASGEAVHSTFRIVAKDGSLHWFEEVSHIIRQQDEIAPVITGILRDVTGRKRTEQALEANEREYRLLIQNLNAGIVVHAPDTRILLANGQASALLGLTIDQLMGKTATDPAWRFVREDETPMPLHDYPVHHVLNTRGPLRDLVIGVNHLGGGRTWLLLNAYPNLAPSGDIRQVVVSFVNITPLKQAEEGIRILNADLERRVHERTTELQAALYELRETQALTLRNDKLVSLGRVCAGLIHEINNPLNYVTQALYVLGRVCGDLSEANRCDFQETLGDAQEGVARVIRIISDLRGFTRTSDDPTRIIKLNSPMETALRLLSHEFKDEISVKIDVPEALTVRGDSNHIVQVLVNLLHNSLDAMRAKRYPAGVSPEISVTATEAAQRVLLKIRDNGLGIPPGIIRNIFDPFFTTKDVGEGMGLGLSICHRIMEEIGGGIDVHSVPGDFCEFALIFPAVDTAAPAAPPGEAELA